MVRKIPGFQRRTAGIPGSSSAVGGYISEICSPAPGSVSQQPIYNQRRRKQKQNTAYAKPDNLFLFQHTPPPYPSVSVKTVERHAVKIDKIICAARSGIGLKEEPVPGNGRAAVACQIFLFLAFEFPYEVSASISCTACRRALFKVSTSSSFSAS